MLPVLLPVPSSPLHGVLWVWEEGIGLPHVLGDSVSGDEGVKWDWLSFLACL